MAASPGRSTEVRTVASVVTTNASAGITFPANAISASDVGRPITGAGIPASTTVLSRESSTAATLSANATASATITATLGVNASTDDNYGFLGWSPETAVEAATYPIAAGAGASAPSVLSDSVTRVVQRYR